MVDAKESRYVFARELFGVTTSAIVNDSGEPGINAIISPAAIQSALTLAYMGAAGSTAAELHAGLKLGIGDKFDIARSFGEFWAKECSYGERGPVLKMVNRLFVNNTLTLKAEFKAMALDYFRSTADPLTFDDAVAATRKINSWVEEETENKIRELLPADAVNADTSAIIVNALYFKGKWAKPFTPETTLKDDFFVDRHKHVEVDMMYQDDKFKYTALPELEASAVQLPYEDSDLSMLIILPDNICGFLEMERKLQQYDLSAIDEKLTMEDVEIAMPKFTIEYDIDLKTPLKQLGISEIFGDRANLSGLFTSKRSHKISAARHRGYIDVNEAGSEAAAVTYLKIVPMMLNMNKISFIVNRPFVFYIRNSRAVFFAGRYVSPPKDPEAIHVPTPTRSTDEYDTDRFN